MVVNSLAFVMTYPKALAFLAAGIAAGIFNAIAGGGTLITFPVLLAFGVPALSANITSSVGNVPSYVGGIHGFRSELKNQGRRIRRLIPAALLGSLCGALLLLTTPATQFRSVAPWLVAFATVLFGVQPLFIKFVSSLHDDHPTRKAFVQIGTFTVAIYGGYFGAGLGIMLLAILGLGLTETLIRINGLRAVLSIVICSLSATVFILHGSVFWLIALCLAIGTLIGGGAGAQLAKILPTLWLRIVVIAVGTVTTIGLFVT